MPQRRVDGAARRDLAGYVAARTGDAAHIWAADAGRQVRRSATQLRAIADHLDDQAGRVPPAAGARGDAEAAE